MLLTPKPGSANALLTGGGGALMLPDLKDPEWTLRDPEWTLNDPEWTLKDPEWTLNETERTQMNPECTQTITKFYTCLSTCSPTIFCLV